MDLNVDELTVDELLVNSSWNMNALNQLFGFIWESPIISHGKICTECNNHWVWFPALKGNKISSTIYSFFNSNHAMDSDWKGWSNIWKLNIIPKAKTFIWLLSHGRSKLMNSCIT